MTGCLIANARILDGTGREPFAGAGRVEGSQDRSALRVIMKDGALHRAP